MAGNHGELGGRARWRRRRGGFSLIEALMVATLLGICAAGVTQVWSVCYFMNYQGRLMQAGKNVLDQEMERVRRLNWTGLTEQTAWTARYYYDSGGNPVGSTSSVTGGFVSYIKVETLDSNALTQSVATSVDTSGGSSRSLRRVSIRVQPTGVSATTSPATAEAVTYLTLGGP